MNSNTNAEKTIGAEALRLSHLEESAKKGELFERLLEHSMPSIYGLEVDNCWRWKYLPEKIRSAVFPGTTRQDVGIDLVAIRKDESFIAIQAKCISPERTLQSKDLTTAIHATVWRKNVTQCWLVTTGKWSRTIEQQLGEGWSILHAPSKWADIPLVLNQKPASMELDDLQKKAFNDVIQGFKDGHNRGRLIMACGTGKTLVSQRLAEAITPKNGIVLYATPSIALTGQSRQAWLKEAKKEIRTVVVCSQADAGDVTSGYVAEIESPATTNPETIVRLVKRARKSLKKSGGGTRLFSRLTSRCRKSFKPSNLKKVCQQLILLLQMRHIEQPA